MVNNGMIMGYTRPGKRLQKAIENGPVEIVGFPIDSMVIIHINHHFPMVFLWFFH